MKEWHIKSHNILLSGDGENTNSLQFNGIWIKFMEQGRSIIIQTHQCAYIDTVTARGEQGRIHSGETTRSDGRMEEINGKLRTTNSLTQRDSLMNLSRVQNLFPQGVRNFNNLIYNIKSYNKAHFSEQKNYYADRKGFGKKYLDGTFTAATTGPFLGSTFQAAALPIKVFARIGTGVDFMNMLSEASFSNLYENLVSQSTKKPVIILDFDKENDSLRDSTGHVIRAFSRNIISKHNEVISDDNIFQAMYHGVSGYIDGYIKRAKSLQ